MIYNNNKLKTWPVIITQPVNLLPTPFWLSLIESTNIIGRIEYIVSAILLFITITIKNI